MFFWIEERRNRNAVKIETQCRFIEHKNKYKISEIKRIEERGNRSAA